MPRVEAPPNKRLEFEPFRRRTGAALRAATAAQAWRWARFVWLSWFSNQGNGSSHLGHPTPCKASLWASRLSCAADPATSGWVAEGITPLVATPAPPPGMCKFVTWGHCLLSRLIFHFRLADLTEAPLNV